NPNDEDLNAIASQNIEQYRAEPTKLDEPTKQKDEPSEQNQGADIEAVESKVKAIERKSRSAKNRQQAGLQLTLIDDVLLDIESQLTLLGYYEAPEQETNATEYPHKAHEKYFKKDLVAFSKDLAKALGWKHDTDKTGQPIYAETNVAPVG